MHNLSFFILICFLFVIFGLGFVCSRIMQLYFFYINIVIAQKYEQYFGNCFVIFSMVFISFSPNRNLRNKSHFAHLSVLSTHAVSRMYSKEQNSGVSYLRYPVISAQFGPDTFDFSKRELAYPLLPRTTNLLQFS